MTTIGLNFRFKDSDLLSTAGTQAIVGSERGADLRFRNAYDKRSDFPVVSLQQNQPLACNKETSFPT